MPLPPIPVEVYSKLIAELFTNVWASCGSSDEVASRLGMSHDTVLSWAQQYRAAGVKLKELPREENRTDHLVREVGALLVAQRRSRSRRSRPD